MRFIPTKQELPTLSVKISLVILIIISLIEFSFVSSTLTWFHNLHKQDTAFVLLDRSNSSSTSSSNDSRKELSSVYVRSKAHVRILLATPQHVLLTPHRVVGGAAMMAFLVIGLCGFLALSIRPSITTATSLFSSNSSHTLSSHDPNSNPIPSNAPSSSYSYTSTYNGALSKRKRALHFIVTLPYVTRRYIITSIHRLRGIHGRNNAAYTPAINPSNTYYASDATTAASSTNLGIGSTNSGVEKASWWKLSSPLARKNWYYFWLAMHLPALLLTILAVAYAVKASEPRPPPTLSSSHQNTTSQHQPQHPFINMTIVAALDGESPYPGPFSHLAHSNSSLASQPWTPRAWVMALVALGNDLAGTALPSPTRRGRWALEQRGVEARDAVATALGMLAGWQLLLTALAVAQTVETLSAWWDGYKWRKDRVAARARESGIEAAALGGVTAGGGGAAAAAVAAGPGSVAETADMRGYNY